MGQDDTLIELSFGRSAEASGRQELKDFFASKGAFKETQRTLTRGEVIKMTHLKDWADPKDVKYAREKYI